MRLLKIKSYAKINLSLNVLGKLNSNLHKIESVISFVKLHDLIYIKSIVSKNHKINFIGKFAKGINKKNSIQKLLTLLEKEKLLKNKKFKITVVKNIPNKSGLGGGSMNAASIINFFIKKKFIKLKQKQLYNITKLIGEDVILGITKKNTILSSNGKLSKFNKSLNFNVLITKPNFGCSTKFIYSKVSTFSNAKYSRPKKSLLGVNSIINSKNDLEKPAFKNYPKLKKINFFLSKLPNLLFVRMTGSGSAILAYFQSKKSAVIASREFKKKFKNYWCIVSKTI